MSEECKLELCAESMAPSRTWAQLHGTSTLAMLTRTSAVGAHAGGENAGNESSGPNHAHTMPPHSVTGNALCLTLCAMPLAAGSEVISSTLPCTSIFQP